MLAPQNPNASTVFVLGSDQPLASVVFFQVQVMNMSVTNTNTNTTANVITTAQNVEFSQLDGLNTFLDATSVAPGTYNSATITLANPVIGFLDTTKSPPAVGILNATSTPAASLTTSSVSVNLPNPITVPPSGSVALILDFHLAQSIQTNSSGDVTGVVNPTLTLGQVTPDSEAAEIDQLRGGVLSVNTSAGSFVLQLPNGRQLTVQTSTNTMFSGTDTIASLIPNTSIVEVSGRFDLMTLNFDAKEVDILSQNSFAMVGLVTFVQVPSGSTAANQIQLLVRDVVPPLSSVSLGQIFSVNLNGTEKYSTTQRVTLPSGFVFDASHFLPGQQVAVGGTLDTSTTPPTLTPTRVMLEMEGFIGVWVPGSTDTTNGTFCFTAEDLAGVLFTVNCPNPNVTSPAAMTINVITTPQTNFIGFSGLGDLRGSNPIMVRVLGVVLADPTSGLNDVVARAVAAFVPPLPPSPMSSNK